MSVYGLTKRMHTTLQFVECYRRQNGDCPSYEELRIALGFKSKSAVARIMDALEERGHIRRLAGKARSVEIIDHGKPDIVKLLPPRTASVLLEFCKQEGEVPTDVVNDAVLVFIDALSDAEREQ